MPVPTVRPRLVLCWGAVACAAAILPRPGAAQILGAISAPVTDVRYEVTVDSAAATNRHLTVVTTVTLAAPGPLVLSLPAWTPGAYEIDVVLALGVGVRSDHAPTAIHWCGTRWTTRPGASTPRAPRPCG